MDIVAAGLTSRATWNKREKVTAGYSGMTFLYPSHRSYTRRFQRWSYFETEGLVSKETELPRRWGSETVKFGIKTDTGHISTAKRSQLNEAGISSVSPSLERMTKG